MRFWRYVLKTAGCWLWTGGKTKAGYGSFSIKENGKKISSLATHASWLLTYGALPNLWLLHQCDNPSCVRPGHLYEGTVKENARDAVDRGRAVFGDRSGRAKLTNAGAVEIDRRVRNGEQQRSVAREFKVSESTVSMIVRRRTWQRVIHADASN